MTICFRCSESIQKPFTNIIDEFMGVDVDGLEIHRQPRLVQSLFFALLISRNPT